MLYKRAFFIIFLIIIVIGTISSLSANDLAGDVINGTSDELNEVDGEFESFEIKNNDILESSDDGTFTALQNKINSATEGATITLENDYRYNVNFGNLNGVEITKSLTINGNGYAIDGASKSALLQIKDAKNVILNNIVFKNGVQSNYGTVNVVNVDYFKFDSCNFINNNAEVGGAVFLYYVNTTVISDCSFNNNKANGAGGAVILDSCTHSSFEYCNFSDNVADGGGALYLCNLNYYSFVGCNFNNNHADNGAVIYLDNVEGFSFEKCNFKNNDAAGDGVLYLRHINDYSFNDCIFENNNARIVGAGGVISSRFVKHSSFYDCVFRDNQGYNGGVFFLIDGNYSIKSSRFLNNSAQSAGGAIYLERVDDFQVDSCSFHLNRANSGGVILGMNSNINLKNSNITSSGSKYFGGAISTNNSDITVDNCCFKDYYSSADSGGAIYNFKGNLTIFGSSFIRGNAKYGGAIASIESRLFVSSSKFINNSAEAFGGAIYNIYGRSAHVSDSFFNNSKADVGGAVCSMMSYSLSFTDNIFLNSTGFESNIHCIYSGSDIVERGNHFENVYHVFISYMTRVGEEIIVFNNKTYDYIVSNDGTFLNNYDINSGGRYTVYDSINFLDYPTNSTIFGNYNTTVIHNHGYYDDGGSLVLLPYEIYDELGNQIYASTTDEILAFFKDNLPTMFNLTRCIFYNQNQVYQDAGGYDEPISVINSVSSDLTYIPSSYDSRNYDYVTSVKDQGIAGNCWAFAGLATLETCIRRATNLVCDFSAENAKDLMAMYSIQGLNLNTNNGGYDSMIMAYLNSWSGPISDINDEYGVYSILSSYYLPILHIQNIKFLPQRKNSGDNDLVKRAIMDYGAVSITFNWPESGYHAVSLVGWNDNYNNVDSLGNYAKGVWIFKNSWGYDWGDKGFGYLSYNTPFASDLNDFCHAYTFIFDKNDAYVINHQYDRAGVSDYLYSDEHVYYKNKFVCKELSEDLAAFSTYFKYPTNYKVSVYKNNELVLSQSGYSDAGYYTIPFDKIIHVNYGTEYVVQIENCNSGENCFPVCQAYELNVATFKENTSFFSYDGVQWFDLYNLDGYHEFLYGGVKSNTCQVACIKVFTVETDLYEAKIDVNRFDSVDVGEEILLNFNLTVNDVYDSTKPKVNVTLITLTINDKMHYPIVRDGKAFLTLKFDTGGTYKLSAQYKNNLFESNIVEFSFKVNKLDTVISAGSVSKVYGGGENSVITLRDDKGNLIKNEVITFTLNGKSTKVRTNANGQAIIPITLAPKSYVATVSFEGSGKYNGATTKVNILVKKAYSKITAKKIVLKAKKTKKYTIVLKDNRGNAIKKVWLTLKVKGKTFKAKTLNNGKATFKLKLPKNGSFKATIKFAGNAYYNPATKKVKVTVKK